MTSPISGRAIVAAASMAFVCALSFARPAPALAATFDYRTQGPLTFSGIPPADLALQKLLAHYDFGQGARLLQWLPGAGLLVAERSGGQVRLEGLAAPLAHPRILATLAQPVRWARARGGELAFVQSANGHPQLYVQSGSGAARQLTHGSMLRGTPRWSPDGHSLAFFGAGPQGGEGAIYVENIAQGGLPRLVIGALHGRWRLLDWSADGQRLLLADVTLPRHTVLYLADVDSGTRQRLTVPAARITEARFAPGGGALYLLSDQDGEFQQLFRFDLRSQQLQPVSTPVDWDVKRFALSADGRYTAYTVDADGRSLLTVIDNQLKLALPLPWLRDGVIGHLSFGAGHRLAISYQSALQPPAVYVYDADDRALVRWTAPAAADAGPPVVARLIHYPTWDRVQGEWRTISADVYLPQTSAGPAPVLILLHDGVGGQFRPRWRPFIRFVVNELGFAVIAPNVRGSSGYGKTFQALADGGRRDDAVRDVGSLLVWIGLQPGLDVQRTVLMGRGYGGWLAVNSLATFDGHLLGVIDVGGIANLADYVRDAPVGRGDARIAAFGDPDDPSTAQFLRRISPVGEVARLRRPMLIVQGLLAGGSQAADARQLAYLLRYHRVPVWLLTASDAGSDFCPPADRAALRLTIAQFLQSLIRGR